MRFLTARRLALVALAPALLLLSAVPGCSNESEGQRCGDDVAANNDDCTAPLVCVTVDQAAGNYRCCNPNAQIVNDSRCIRSLGPAPGTDAGSDDAANSGGSGGTAGGSGGTSAGGSGGTGGTTSAGGSGGTGDAAAAGAADMSTGGI
jgi:uncharacterized membrane protein YgcG